MISRRNLLFLSTILIYSVLYLYFNLNHVIINYLDESAYIACGIKYVNGACPLNCNPEHPPLAKYIYGFVAEEYSIIGLRVFLYVLSLFSIIIVYYTLNTIFSWREAFVGGLLLATSGLVVNVGSSALLDNVSLFFIIASYSLFVTRGVKSKYYLILSSVLAALGFYSKYIAVFYLLSVLILIILSKDGKYKKVYAYYFIASIVFIAMLAPVMYYRCIHGEGLEGVVRVVLKSFSYHEKIHAYGPAVTGISALKIFTGVEVWKLYEVNFTIVNNTIYMDNNPVPKGFLVKVDLREYAPYPAILLILTAFKLVRGEVCGRIKGEQALQACRLGVASFLSSLLLGLMEPLAWYYLMLYYFGALAAPTIVEGERARKMVVIINLIYLLVLIFLGVYAKRLAFDITV